MIQEYAPVEVPIPERITLSLNVVWTEELAKQLQTSIKIINLDLYGVENVTDRDLEFIASNAKNVAMWHIDHLSGNNWEAVASLLMQLTKLERLAITNWNQASAWLGVGVNSILLVLKWL